MRNTIMGFMLLVVFSFPLYPQGIVVTKNKKAVSEVRLFDLKRFSTYDEVVSFMAKDGFKPASIEYTRDLVLNEPRLHMLNIKALGTVCGHNGHYVATVFGHQGSVGYGVSCFSRKTPFLGPIIGVHK